MNKDLLSLDSFRPNNRLLILKLSSDVSFVLMISSSWICKLIFMALRFAQLMFPRSRALRRSHEWSRKYNQYRRYLLALYHARTNVKRQWSIRLPQHFVRETGAWTFGRSGLMYVKFDKTQCLHLQSLFYWSLLFCFSLTGFVQSVNLWLRKSHEEAVQSVKAFPQSSGLLQCFQRRIIKTKSQSFCVKSMRWRVSNGLGIMQARKNPKSVLTTTDQFKFRC